jgi:NodT family efflux transporter outer membrane factor (OMF) lipoprotein
MPFLWPLRSACAGFAIAVLLSACATRDPKPLPQPVLPDRFTVKHVIPDTLANAQGERKIRLADWWIAFGNDELDALIAKALESSPDIRIAESRVAQARARSDQARAGALPTVTGIQQATLQAPKTSDVGTVSTGQAFTVYQGALKVDYRLDVWGEQSAIEESATLKVVQAKFDKVNAVRVVTTNVASAYINYLLLNDRLRVAREIERVLGEMYQAVDNRFVNRDATILEFEQQRSGLYALRATIPVIEQQREELGSKIFDLVGAVPGSIKLSDKGLDALFLPSFNQELPSAVVFRRPDVRAVEARLQAAGADVDVARARLMPTVDFSSQVGVASQALSALINPQSFFLSALSSMAVSLFDSGRRDSEVAFSKAVYEEMAETYLRTIYQATREIENSLSGVQNSQSQARSQGEAAQATRRAWDVVVKAYDIGAADVMTLLDTERAYYKMQEEYLRARMEHLRSFVTLCHALGGGVADGAIAVALR